MEEEIRAERDRADKRYEDIKAMMQGILDRIPLATQLPQPREEDDRAKDGEAVDVIPMGSERENDRGGKGTDGKRGKSLGEVPEGVQDVETKKLSWWRWHRIFH